MKKEITTLTIGLLLLVVPIGLLIQQGVQYYEVMKFFTSIDPQTIMMFKVYSPNDLSGRQHPFSFTVPDPIIQEFFQSIKDYGLYLPMRDPVDSPDHTWFLEVGTNEGRFQISFLIPSGKGELVVGNIEKAYGDLIINYGYFQSRQLFQWYQTYKDRWLTPAAPQPGATATPTPP